MDADRQATPATTASITYHPLTPAMRAVIDRNVRRYRRLAIGVAAVCYALAVVATFAIPTPGSQLGIGEVFAVVGIVVVMFLFTAVVLGAGVAWALGQDLHPPIYCAASGPLYVWRRSENPAYGPDGQNIMVAFGYLILGNDHGHERIKLNRACQDILYELREVSIDCLAHSNTVLEICDMSGRVLYRAPGYQRTGAHEWATRRAGA